MRSLTFAERIKKIYTGTFVDGKYRILIILAKNSKSENFTPNSPPKNKTLLNKIFKLWLFAIKKKKNINFSAPTRKEENNLRKFTADDRATSGTPRTSHRLSTRAWWTPKLHYGTFTPRVPCGRRGVHRARWTGGSVEGSGRFVTQC